MIKTTKKGIIVINCYANKNLSENQAKRMQSEFKACGLNVKIVKTNFDSYLLDKQKIKSKYKNIDFAVFLDKDKYFSEVLTSMGVKLFNSHNSIRVCDDKGRTYIALANNKIKIPKTVLAPLCYYKDAPISEESVKKITEALNFPIIVKESYGSLGQGVYKVNDKNQLLSIMEELKLKPHLYQEYISNKVGEDIRVILVGKKVISAMKRKNPNDFRSNVYQGGVGEKFILPKKYKQTCEKVAKLLDLDYCGIDLLEDGTETPVVCEVNSNAFFDGIEKATCVNVAKTYVLHILKNI